MIDRMPIDEWLSFDREYSAPTFFARPAWSLALADAFESLVPAPLRVSVDGETVIVPTVQSRRVRFRLRENLAFPLGGYCCVLDSQGRVAKESIASNALRELGRLVDHLQIIPWPLGPRPEIPHATAVIHETAVIDCNDGFEAVVANIRGVTRRMAGQAERRGVVCERVPIGELGTYFNVLKEASTGWGLPKPPVSYELLHAVLDRGGDDAQLWLAKLDGTPIGGGIVLFGSEELFFWSAAMRREFGRYRPSNALNLALLQAACDRGVRWYNLGASEGLEGVARFKQDLGARPVPYAELSLRRPAFVIYERVRHAVRARQRSA